MLRCYGCVKYLQKEWNQEMEGEKENIGQIFAFFVKVSTIYAKSVRRSARSHLNLCLLAFGRPDLRVQVEHKLMVMLACRIWLGSEYYPRSAFALPLLGALPTDLWWWSEQAADPGKKTTWLLRLKPVALQGVLGTNNYDGDTPTACNHTAWGCKALAHPFSIPFALILCLAGMISRITRVLRPRRRMTTMMSWRRRKEKSDCPSGLAFWTPVLSGAEPRLPPDALYSTAWGEGSETKDQTRG
ncbi:hypothetical protein ACRRTK_017121 [Alexandromys fortis]